MRPLSTPFAAANDNPLKPAWERRAKPRRRVLLKGVLAYRQEGFGSACSIRDLSEHGAQVRPVSAASLPRDPFLVIVRGGVLYRTRTVWSRGGLIGLALFESDALRPAPALAGEAQPG